MFEPTEYTQSQNSRGDRKSALETVKIALLGQGFEITRCSDEALEARGPGMNSTNLPPARGATRISIAIRRSKIELRAELHGDVWARVRPPAMVDVRGAPGAMVGALSAHGRLAREANQASPGRTASEHGGGCELTPARVSHSRGSPGRDPGATLSPP